MKFKELVTSIKLHNNTIPILAKVDNKNIRVSINKKAIKTTFRESHNFKTWGQVVLWMLR